MYRLVTLLLVLFSAWPLWADTPADNKEQSNGVKALLARIDKLEKRVAELEARADAAPSSAQPAAPASSVVAPAETASASPVNPATTQKENTQAQAASQAAGHGLDHSAQVAEGHYPALHFQGFGDIDFSATDRRGAHSGFNLGQFVLHLASPLSKKINYFGEISFNAKPNGFTVELERTLIRYDYDDYFKLSFGRYHTPINYWNTAFHHGLWLQTTISRPDMIQFGGIFLPVHFVGLQAEGSIPSAGLGLGYNVGLGNGRGSIISRAGDAGDINNNRAWVANIYSRPHILDGLQMGASVYQDEIAPGPGNPLGTSPYQGPASPAIPSAVREWITAAHVIWNRETPEFLAEFANVHHREIGSSETYDSQAFYVQLAYRLPIEAKRWKPYYRYDFIHAPKDEPVFGLFGVERSTLGMRFDISDFAAFKGEYRNTWEPGKPRTNGVFFQTTFAF